MQGLVRSNTFSRMLCMMRIPIRPAFLEGFPQIWWFFIQCFAIILIKFQKVRIFPKNPSVFLFNICFFNHETDVLTFFWPNPLRNPSRSQKLSFSGPVSKAKWQFVSLGPAKEGKQQQTGRKNLGSCIPSKKICCFVTVFVGFRFRDVFFYSLDLE